MTCSLCGQRKARRACPALGRQICAVCCGTKRLTEIKCPSDCAYLVSSHEHPPAVVIRQHQRDVRAVRPVPAQLRPPPVPALSGDHHIHCALRAARASAAYRRRRCGGNRSARRDVRDSVSRPDLRASPSVPSSRTSCTALKPLLAEAGRGGGSAFERDAGVMLRRIQEAVRSIGAAHPENRRAYLDLLARVTAKTDGGDDRGQAEREASRVIVP